MSARPATTPNYQRLPDEEFQTRVEQLWSRFADCDLCAYDCQVDRTAGDTGACRVDDTAYVSSYFDHHDEEDVLRGHNGSGTIFLAHCNMTCVFFETSHQARGEPATPEGIAEMALELQAQGVITSTSSPRPTTRRIWLTVREMTYRNRPTAKTMNYSAGVVALQSDPEGPSVWQTPRAGTGKRSITYVLHKGGPALSDANAYVVSHVSYPTDQTCPKLTR